MRAERGLGGEVREHPHPSPPPAGYALPTCHAVLGRAASAPRGAGFQPACRYHRHRRQGLAVAAGARAESLPYGLIHRFPFVT
jgi:hypothetical protein